MGTRVTLRPNRTVAAICRSDMESSRGGRGRSSSAGRRGRVIAEGDTDEDNATSQRAGAGLHTTVVCLNGIWCPHYASTRSPPQRAVLDAGPQHAEPEPVTELQQRRMPHRVGE